MTRSGDFLINNNINNNDKMNVNEIRSDNDNDENDDSIVIGGGSINEKKRYYNIINNNDNNIKSSKHYYDPRNNLSHLLHSLVGLDRYPNYISRWNYNLENDVNQLEHALLEQLEKVKKQKEIIRQRNEEARNLINDVINFYNTTIDHDDDDNIGDNIDDVDWNILFNQPDSWEEIQNNILHPKCVKAIFQSKMFIKEQYRPSVNDIISGKIKVDIDEAQCEEWLTEEMFDVYSFPLFQPEFCNKIKMIMKRLILFQQHQQKKKKNDDDHDDDVVVNTTASSILGSRPIDMDMIGLSWLNNLIFHLIVRPLSRHLFKQTEGIKDDLDWRQGYIAGYSHSPTIDPKNDNSIGIQRSRLVPHTDDSEVTLNIGMGDTDFEGGELTFWGLRNSYNEGKFNGQFQPIMGTALIHAGRHLHEVQTVTKGNRYAYILWARSWKGLRSGTCPCCWLNRRQASSFLSESAAKTNRRNHICICGPEWN